MPQDTKVTINHFVTLLDQAEKANSENGKVQLAQSGELYISKPRSGTKALISNLWAGFNALFGNRDWVLQKNQIENANRQAAAIKIFSQLLEADGMERNLTDQTNDESIPIGSPAFYKKHIEQNMDNLVVIRAVNRSRSDAVRLIPAKCSKLKSLPLPDSEERINCKDLSPEQRAALATIYNTLIELRIAKAREIDANICKFNDEEILLLRQLGSDPKLIVAASQYLAHTRSFLTEMPLAKTASGLATLKVSFSCWNTFWKKKFSLKLPNSAMPDLLEQCAFQQGISELAQKTDPDCKEFLFLCHTPSISPVSKEAQVLFQNAQIVYTKQDDNAPPTYNTATERGDDSNPPEHTEFESREQAGVNNIRGALDEDAWDSFASLCGYMSIQKAHYKATAETYCVQSGVNNIKELFNAQAWDSFASLCQLNIPKTDHLQHQIEAKYANDTQPASISRSAIDVHNEGMTFFLDLGVIVQPFPIS